MALSTVRLLGTGMPVLEPSALVIGSPFGPAGTVI